MSTTTTQSRFLPILLSCAALGMAILMLLAWLNVRGEEPLSPAGSTASTPAQIERGAYLARAGNCAACHTARGGEAYAGGKGIPTPFGTVYAGNLTPATTGLGEWTAAEFWRAMHNGRSKDGRLLYPAFPYPSFTLVTRDDSDAIFAYLRSLPAVEQPPRLHELSFPYNTQLALAVWRALYFKPSSFEPQAQQSTAHNRGAYLVQGLGHCAACHATRNALGASANNGAMDGSVVAMQNWYAPPLGPYGDKAAYAQTTAGLLKNGITPHSSAKGLMAEVVSTSTQHLNDADLTAIADYLSELPVPSLASPSASEPNTDTMKLGAAVYNKHCADCHGRLGQGVANIYPGLAGNRQVTQPSTTNLLQIVKGGGFAPSTAANPRPYGMPPFAQTLKDDELAAVITYVRNSWGNRGGEIRAIDTQLLK